MPALRLRRLPFLWKSHPCGSAMNRCPPGGGSRRPGARGAGARPRVPLDPAIAAAKRHGRPHPTRRRASSALPEGTFPVNTIVGAAEASRQYSGAVHRLDLSVAPCPVDCIAIVAAAPSSSSAAPRTGTCALRRARAPPRRRTPIPTPPPDLDASADADSERASRQRRRRGAHPGPHAAPGARRAVAAA